jgi:dihydroorotate dehydrogenase
MSWSYRNLLRPFLFRLNSEAIHDWTLKRLEWASRRPRVCAALAALYQAAPLPVELFGLRFPNPVGLAAGMDKQGVAVPVWAALGFGFSELGGVTWRAQPGNPAPRMFRAVADQALINRMGFNNDGAEAMARRLEDWRRANRWPHHPVGINLGKSKATPLENAAQDYADSFRVLWPMADFFVVNVSSPNTPNLRQLQDKAALDEILAALQGVNSSLARQLAASGAGTSERPVFVKVAPDLTFDALDEILELTGPRRIAGIVATNTTIKRPTSNQPQLQRVYAESGGLSGKPLSARSTDVIRHLYRQSKGELPVIGVGGIFNAADAWEKIAAGASLVQLYTGLVYEGPAVVKNIVAGLRSRLKSHGFSSISEAVGCQAGGGAAGNLAS